MTDRNRIAVALTGVAEIYGAKMPATKLKGYLNLLGNTDADLIEQALHQLAKELKWYPKPSEILSRTRALARDQAMQQQSLPEAEVSDEERETCLEIIHEFKSKMGWE